MEAYNISDDPILGYPPVSDNSIDLQQIVYFFGRRYRHHATSSVNRYLYSIDNDFVTIIPVRSNFRVIGRVDIDFPIIKRTIDYDVFFYGSFDRCVEVFQCLVSRLLLSKKAVQPSLVPAGIAPNV